MNNNKYYVYELKDPRTNKPFYVGKGTGDRIQAHVTEAHREKHKWLNVIKCQIILNIERCGLSIITEKVIDNVSEQEAYDIETALIIKYGKLVNGTGILSNIMDGGRGGSGNPKIINAYTETGALLNTFSSLDHAAKSYNIHKSTICIIGKYAGPTEAAKHTPANATGISDCCAGRKKHQVDCVGNGRIN